jgi:hypothetical protein
MVVWSTEANTKRLEVRLQLGEHPVACSEASNEKYKLHVTRRSAHFPIKHSIVSLL